MANTSSAKKAIIVSAKKAANNVKVRSKMRSLIKDFKKTVLSGDTKVASEQLSSVNSQIDQAAKKNVIHANTASRYKSRLAKFLNKAK